MVRLTDHPQTSLLAKGRTEIEGRTNLERARKWLLTLLRTLLLAQAPTMDQTEAKNNLLLLVDRTGLDLIGLTISLRLLMVSVKLFSMLALVLTRAQTRALTRPRTRSRTMSRTRAQTRARTGDLMSVEMIESLIYRETI